MCNDFLADRDQLRDNLRNEVQNEVAVIKSERDNEIQKIHKRLVENLKLEKYFFHKKCMLSHESYNLKGTTSDRKKGCYHRLAAEGKWQYA